MTTLDFLNNNSTSIIDQSKWNDEIFKNEYDSKKEELKNEYNDFGINGLFTNVECENELNPDYNDYTKIKNIDKLNLDIIDKISLKIEVNNPIDKLLLAKFNIKIYTKSVKYNPLICSNILDLCLLSYLNNEHIEEDDNIITIPIIQFNIFEHGYLYEKLTNKKISVIFECMDITVSKIINKVKIIFYGRKYYDFNSLINYSTETYYKSIDINWYVTKYNSNGNKIKYIDTKYQFIVFKLIKCSNDNYDEFINNQPNIEEVSFEYERREPFIYDIKYMNKMVLFGINIYILPLYPEFVNLNNIIYYLKNSENNLNLCNYDYHIKIKTNIVNEDYEIYFSFYGEWI